MKAIIIGATGATGNDLLKKLIEDPDFEEIHTLVRKKPQIEDAKLFSHIVDFEKPELWKHLVIGDVAFSCMGTTLRDAGSKEAQRKIDFDYQFQFAKAAKENQVDDFILVSAYGASPTSKVFYSKMKGELEEEIKAMHFHQLTIFKPGLLQRKNTQRIGEVIGLKVLNIINKIGLFNHYKPLPTEVLAQAMINAAKIKSFGFSEIKLGSIFSFAEKKVRITYSNFLIIYKYISI